MSEGVQANSHLEMTEQDKYTQSKKEFYIKKKKANGTQRKVFIDKLTKDSPSISQKAVTRMPQDSNRFTDAMNRVTDLLKVNQSLRDENNEKEDDIRRKNNSLFDVNEENEDLRERIEILEGIVRSERSTFE